MAEKLKAEPKRRQTRAGEKPPPSAPSGVIATEHTSLEGDNLTPEQEARAMRIYHVNRLRGQLVLIERAKAELDALRSVQNDFFRLAKVDTKYSRKELSDLMAKLGMNRDEFREEEERRATLFSDWDMPTGHQGDLLELLARMPAEAKDEQAAKGLGYAAGLRGDACVMPEGMHVRFSPAFGEGWSKGQEELAWALSAAGRIVDRKKGAGGGPTAEEIARQDEAADEDEGIDPDAIARDLVKSGWTEKASETEDA